MSSTTRDIARADRQFDRDAEREPGCHRRAEKPSRSRYYFLAAAEWTCCGGQNECVCPKEEP